MSSRYNREHLDTFRMVDRRLNELPPAALRRLREQIRPYLDFRDEVRRFQEDHFSRICTVKCFQDGTSACCAREGIAAFFADVVINTLLSSPEKTAVLLQALEAPSEGPNCVYLGPAGCLWHLKPIACEMFLCDSARGAVLEADEEKAARWDAFRARERGFTWPDRPVLFDDLEASFLRDGLDSPLMFCHKSPGLLRVKARWDPGTAEGERRKTEHTP